MEKAEKKEPKITPADQKKMAVGAQKFAERYTDTIIRLAKENGR